MAQSKKDLKNAQKKKEAAQGITAADKDPKLAKKQAANDQKIKCTVCMMEFKLTAKMADAKQHAESKHPKSKYEECFPAADSNAAAA